MGANVSQEINTDIQILFTQLNTTTASCITQGSLAQNITINCPSCPGGTQINVNGNNLSQSVSYVQNCTAGITNNSDINQNVSAQITAAAMVITQQFSLSEADANQVTNYLEQISNNITNATVVTCLESVGETQGINIVCPTVGSSTPTGPCSINVNSNTISQQYTPINNCLLTVTNSTGLVQEITNLVSQTATAEVQSLLGPLVWIIIVIILLIGGVSLGGTKLLTNPYFLLALAGFIGLYFLVAYFEKWIPFS